jgi:hypothetical protein
MKRVSDSDIIEDGYDGSLMNLWWKREREDRVGYDMIDFGTLARARGWV